MYSGFPTLGYSNIMISLCQPQIPHELPENLTRALGKLVVVNSLLIFSAKCNLKLYLYLYLYLILQVCCRRWANTLIRW